MTRNALTRAVGLVVICAALPAVAIWGQQVPQQVPVVEPQAHQAPSPATLKDLRRHQTGWILLGLLEADADRWVDHHNRYTIIGTDGADGQPLFVPAKGDSIKLLSAEPVIIVGFKKTGEMNAFKAPDPNVPIEKATDHTGVLLPVGFLAKIEEVQINTLPKQAQGLPSFRIVWARVSAR